VDNELSESERWLARSKVTLVAAQSLLEQHLLADSVSRIYYAMFYAAKALFIRDDLVVKKHAAILSFFGQKYVRTNIIAPEFHQMLIKAFQLRQKSDYDIYWDISMDDVEADLNAARQFVAEIERYLTADGEN